MDLIPEAEAKLLTDDERKFAWFGREPGIVQALLPWETSHIEAR